MEAPLAGGRSIEIWLRAGRDMSPIAGTVTSFSAWVVLPQEGQRVSEGPGVLNPSVEVPARPSEVEGAAQTGRLRAAGFPGAGLPSGQTPEPSPMRHSNSMAS